AINHFYNRAAIPVGDYKGYAEKIEAPELTYDQHLAKEYPHNLASWKDATDGIKLYREVLASAEEKSITVVIIGTMHNFYGLLQSGPDQFSKQNGIDLVATKVKQVVTMGGNFIDGQGYDRTNWGGADQLCEYTSWSCIREERNRMCRYVIENCPAPFIASGWEVGCGDYYDANYGNVITGQSLKKLDTTHIVRRSYEYHFQKRGGDADISRHSNDQCALHYAIRGEGANYTAYLDGKITLTEQGVCHWDKDINKGQGYIQKKRDKNLIASEIEALMMGNIPEVDQTPPPAPSKLKMKKKGDQGILKWEASKEETPGSWVVAYHVYYDGVLLATAYGTQYTFEAAGQKRKKFKVKAINATGGESL
ncbi:MAG: hypothetical protein AAF242_11755, partial [Bacteroidota bacterium]